MIVCLSLRYTAEPHLVNIVSLNPQILTCARQYTNFSHLSRRRANNFCDLWQPILQLWQPLKTWQSDKKNSDSQFCNSPLCGSQACQSQGGLSSPKQLSWTTMYLHSNTDNSTNMQPHYWLFASWQDFWWLLQFPRQFVFGIFMLQYLYWI